MYQCCHVLVGYGTISMMYNDVQCTNVTNVYQCHPMPISNSNARNSLKLIKRYQIPMADYGIVLRFWNAVFLQILADSFQTDESLGVHPIVALSEGRPFHAKSFDLSIQRIEMNAQ